jgi:hypothetical protein
MNDHAGVWDPIEDFPIAKLFMEEDFHCKDGTYSASIAADAAVARSSSPAAATRDKALKTQSGPTAPSAVPFHGGTLRGTLRYRAPASQVPRLPLFLSRANRLWRQPC